MSFRYATKGNGTSTYGTIPTWTASRWEIEFDVVFPTTLTTADSAVYLDSNVSSDRIYFYTVATVARMDYPPGTSLLMDGVPVARNTTQHPTDGLAHHMKLTGTILGGIGTILRRYITPNFAPGALFNLSLKDLDNPVTNSRFYPMDEDATPNVFVDTLNGQNGTWYSRTSANLIYLDTGTPNTDLAVIDSYLSLESTQFAQAPIGATRLATRGNTAALSYGRIPVWTATNWEVEFDVLFAATATGDRYFIDTDASGGSRLALYTNTTGKLQWSTYAGVTVYLDNVLIANNTVSHPVDGVLRKLRIVGTNQTMQFGTILSRFSITQTSESVIFNLRLTDLDTPANSRFYPMDEAYTARSSTFFDTLTGLGANLVPNWATTYVNQSVTTTLVDGKLTVTSITGGSNRVEFPVSGLTIGKVYLLEVECNKVVGSLATIDGATWGEEGWNGITWTTRDTFKKLVTATATSGLTRIYPGQSGSAGDTIEIYNVSIREANTAGTWYTRTAGDVVTVYPGAIKPSDEFWVACKYECTDNTPTSGFNHGWGLRNVATNTSLSAYNPESNKQFGLQLTNSGVMVKEHFAVTDPVRVSQADGVNVVIYHIRPAASKVDVYWDGGSASDSTIWNINADRPFEFINLNGKPAGLGTSTAKPAQNFHYFYLYKGSPSDADINALMAGENPMYIGDVLQGYSLVGSGDEINGGPALTLYGAFDGSEWYVPRTGRIRKVVSPPVRSPVRSVVRSPVN